MIWFIDIDGCLCDNRESFIRRCSTWLTNNMIEHKDPVMSEYYFGDIFGVDKMLHIPCFESEEFAGYYIEDPMDGAVEFLQEVKDRGDMVVILTAREADSRIPITEELHAFLGKNYESRKSIAIGVITQIWLQRHNIPYDNVIYRKDKVALCKEHAYCAIAIDDDPKILEGYINNNINCVSMRTEYNDGKADLEADTWFDIHRMLNAGILDSN